MIIYWHYKHIILFTFCKLRFVKVLFMKKFYPYISLIIIVFACKKDPDPAPYSSASPCANDNSIDQNNRSCPIPSNPSNSSYSESISGDQRTISTNGIPSHNYNIQIPNIVSNLNSSPKTYVIDKTPELSSFSTSITKPDGSPNYAFGVALNGVKIDPAPGEPFIFTNSSGDYNWDWVMEPNNNMDAVGLDCAIAHVQPNGEYHYHGNMSIYADQIHNDLGSGSNVPSVAHQIGWAADGFPIIYKYGPNANGTIVELSSSWQLKSGERPGDGDSEPCGEYNGKYTNDYEYVSGLGDLDECNGIAADITISGESFSYFYVITESFPVISRCISGTPSNDFKIGP